MSKEKPQLRKGPLCPEVKLRLQMQKLYRASLPGRFYPTRGGIHTA